MKAGHIVIVGAGPAGLGAAREAAAAGRECVLIDEQGSAGGQIWRGGQGEDALAKEWLSGAAEVVNGTVVDADAGARRLTIEREGRSRRVPYDRLILATGARELFLPFPGWTTPGVFGAGGLQALVKSGFTVAGKRVLVGGTGPLLLAVADFLRRKGARVAAVLEQAPARRLMRFGLSLAGSPGKLAQGWRLRRGLDYRLGRWVAEYSAGAARLNDGSRLECDLLAVGYGLTPNTELAEALGCRVENGCVQVEQGQRAGDGIFAAGEVTGIGGVEKSLAEGRAAGRAACGRELGELEGEVERGRAFARRLAAAFALREELRALPSPETIVCRCEDVTWGELRRHAHWREAKLQTRCGMGACQGRVCGAANRFLMNWPGPAVRPPVLPARVSTLMGDWEGEV